MADEETLTLCAILLQSIARRFLARCHVITMIIERTEKIWDPRRNLHYFYNTITDLASWSKPKLLRDVNIEEVAQTYLPDEAAIMIVRQCLRRAALRRVRVLYQETIIATFDESFDATYYYNPLTGSTQWELPSFMDGSIAYEYDKLPLGGTVHVAPEDSDSESEDSDLSIDSELAREKRRKKRKFPRSHVQIVVDRFEDNIRTSSIKFLNLENCHISHRLTDRIWDFTTLETLNLSKNSITSISSKVQYLIKLKDLNISHNLLFKLPRQIEDLSLLKKFKANHNNFRTFTGFFWKCMKLEEIDFSFNQFEQLPITHGNLELLKATKQWEVGIGVLKNLKVLNLQGNSFKEWPEQLDRNTKLLDMNISQNFLTSIPSLVSKNANLQVLDLANNLIRHLPTELYYLPIKRLILNNNCLEDLPALILPKATDGSITNHGKSGLSGIKMSHIVEINLAYNKLSKLDFRVGLFEKAKKFIAHDNNISEIHDNIGLLTDLRDMDISRNRIDGNSMVGIGRCAGLTKLNLSFNCIDQIPDSFSALRGLTLLNASNNNIKMLPERAFLSFPSMNLLDLHNNQISVLPMSMYAMRKIVTLDLSYNCINHGIPKQLEQMSILETLLLNHNCITELPDSVARLSRLQVLEVDTNKLKRFPTTISACTSLRRVTTALNQIEIKPHGLAGLPNLLSWDISWNHDIVSQCVDWKKKEMEYKRDVDIMSAALFRQMLKRAQNKIGLRDESKNVASVHLMQDTILAIDDDASLVSKGSSKSSKKLKKNSKKAKREEEKRLEMIEKQKVQKEAEFKELLDWQRRLKSHFETHVTQYSSRVYFRETDEDVDVTDAVLNREIVHLDELTFKATARYTSVQLLFILREMHLTSRTAYDPMLYFDEIDDKVPSFTLLQSFDLGYRYQAAIRDFEYLATEVMSCASIMRTEMKQLAVQDAKEKRAALFIKPNAFQASRRGSADGSFQSGQSSALNSSQMNESAAEGTMTSRSHFEASPMTSRSQFGGMTARSNSDEANALLDMALGAGGEPMTARDEDASLANNSNLLGLDPDGKDLEDPTIHDVEVTFNEVTLERECPGKNNLVKFNEPPLILHAQLLGPSTHEFYEIAFECYYGLGVSLLYRIEKFAAAIRLIERRGSLQMSLLNIAHRKGSDFKDFVIEVYDETLELMKKKEENEKGSFAERKKKKMAAFAAASGANDMEVDEPETEGKDDGKPKVRKKQRAKFVKVGVVEDNSEEEKRLRMEKAAAAGQEEYFGEPIESHLAQVSVSYLYQQRRLLSIWANKAFDSAAEMIKLRGWDVLASAFDGEEEATVEHGAGHMRGKVMNLHLHRAKALQYTDQYDKAIREYNALIVLCRGQFHRTASLEVIKTYLAKSDFHKAKMLLRTYIETDVDDADIRYPEPFELLKNHRSLALLCMFANCGVKMLNYAGYHRPQHTLTFQIRDDGCFIKPDPIKESEVWKVTTFEKDDELLKSKQMDLAVAIETEAKEQSCKELKDVIGVAKFKFKNQLDWVVQEMELIKQRQDEMAQEQQRQEQQQQ